MFPPLSLSALRVVFARVPHHPKTPLQRDPGGERGANEWEGGAHQRKGRRRRRSGSEHSRRGYRSSEDEGSGEGSLPRGTRRGGEKSHAGELRVDDDGDDENVKAGAGGALSLIHI